MSIDARLAEIHALPWDQIPAALEALAREQAATLDAIETAMAHREASTWRSEGQLINAIRAILRRD